MLLPLAAAVALAGAFVWSRTLADGRDDDVILVVPGEYSDPSATNPEHAGDVLAPFELVGVDGELVTLEPQGRPMVVNMWQSICPPCSRELAAFGKVENDVGGDVRFVGVNNYDDLETMSRYAADRGADYEQLSDPDDALGTELGILQYPVTLFVSAEGEIVAQTGVLNEAELRTRVAELLA